MADAADALRDAARLRALRETGLLDTPSEEVFDRLTRLVCRLLGAPVALVSLVDSDRQFFKSMVGLPQPWALRRETPLSHSFCQHVVTSGAPLLVQDARLHPVLSRNRAVPELGVVAYLGMPLTTAEDQVLGSLCAIDTQRRDWTAADASALRDLAALAMGEISVRRAATHVEERLRDEIARREWGSAQGAPAQADEAIGRAGHRATRDIANVLHAVDRAVHLALDRIDKDPVSARQVLETVSGAAARGASVARRVVAFRREHEARVERVNLTALLDGIEEVLAQSVSLHGLQVVVDAPPSLPEVLADRGALETALVSLATNARRAMPRGGSLIFAATRDTVAPDELRAHLPALGPGQYVRVSLVDTGDGLDAVALARAAELQITTREPAERAGFGISVASDFTQQAGGAFAIASEPGRGTIVTLWLPVAPDPQVIPARKALPGGATL
jgi:signal transduction histidine kinase